MDHLFGTVALTGAAVLYVMGMVMTAYWLYSNLWGNAKPEGGYDWSQFRRDWYFAVPVLLGVVALWIVPALMLVVRDVLRMFRARE